MWDQPSVANMPCDNYREFPRQVRLEYQVDGGYRHRVEYSALARADHAARSYRYKHRANRNHPTTDGYCQSTA